MMPAGALVTAAHGRRGRLETDGRERAFIVKGRRLRIACGDRVQFEQRPGSEDLLVTAIEPRRNVLARQGARAERSEVVAANLSQIIVVCAVRPEPDLFLLDRYLCAAEIMGCRAAILWNKCDLTPAPPSLASAAAALGYPLLQVSAGHASGLDALGTLLDGAVSILVGQSGVGKSSLVNALVPGVAAGVGALSTGNDMGTHTTSDVLMYPVGSGGRLVDAPGVRDFIPALDPACRVDQGFAEIRRLASACRFADCRHVTEPACRVRQALADGELSPRRYESYRELLGLVEAARRALHS